MSRRFTIVSLVLTAAVAFLVGTIFAGGGTRTAGIDASPETKRAATRTAGRLASPLVNFADVVDRVNPAVVNIDATSKDRGKGRRRGRPGNPRDNDGDDGGPDVFDRPPFQSAQPRRDGESTRR